MKLLAAALLVALAAASCGAPSPPPKKPTGEPVPSASTSAEPLWLRTPMPPG